MSSAARLFGGQQFADQAAGADKLRDAVGQLAGKMADLVNWYNAAAAAGKKGLAGDFLASLAKAKGQLAATDAELAKAEEAVEKLARAIGQQLGEAIRGTFQGTLAQGLGVFGRLQGLLGQTAALTNPADYQRLQRAYADLGGVIGQLLVPVLHDFTQLIRGVADFILNLDPGVKRLIVTVGELALAFGVGSKAVSLLGVVAGPAFKLVQVAMAALIGEATALNVLTAGLPIIIGALVTGLGALGLAAAQGGESGGKLAQIWERVKDTFAPLGRLIAALMEDLAPLGAALGAVFEGVLQGILEKVGDMIREMTALFALVETGLSRLKNLDFKGGFGSEVEKRFAELTGGGKKDKDKKTSVGSAVTPASYTSLEDLGKAGRASAFGAAASGKTIEDITREASEKAALQRDRQIDLLEELAKSNSLQTVAADATKDALANVLGAINPIAGLALRLKF